MKPIPIRQIPPGKKEGDFRIRTVESILDGSNLTQDLHRHNFFFILAITKGKGTHEIDFTSYPIKEHAIFILRPGQVHKLTIDAGSTGFLLEFNAGFYHTDRNTSHVLREATSANFCEVEVGTFEKLHNLLVYIYQEFQEQNEGYQQIIRSNLEIFFIEFLRQRKQQRTATKGNDYEQERFQEFQALIEKHAADQLPVSSYADMMNLSVYQLNNITKTIFNKTASDVITDYLVLESKRYLLATSDQVNQIAAHLGYDDPSYFIRFFKKHTGYSPETFRKHSK